MTPAFRTFPGPLKATIVGVPAVGIGSVRVPALKLPRVKVDDEELMRTAAAHNVGEEVGLPGRVDGWIAQAKELGAE